jgi:hypothetical protein
MTKAKSRRGTKKGPATKRAPKRKPPVVAVQPDPAPVGRPSLYQLAYAEQARKLCLLGATDAELADFFGVQESTINNWKLDHPEFLESVKEGKELADANVADRLYQRATGYEHDAVKILTVSQGENQGAAVEQVPYVERYPPDTAAAIFWLKNRQKGKWRDRIDHQVGADESLAALIAQAFTAGGVPK